MWRIRSAKTSSALTARGGAQETARSESIRAIDAPAYGSVHVARPAGGEENARLGDLVGSAEDRRMEAVYDELLDSTRVLARARMDRTGSVPRLAAWVCRSFSVPKSRSLVTIGQLSLLTCNDSLQSARFSPSGRARCRRPLATVCAYPQGLVRGQLRKQTIRSSSGWKSGATAVIDIARCCHASDHSAAAVNSPTTISSS
jgi:hypothetical protein